MTAKARTMAMMGVGFLGCLAGGAEAASGQEEPLSLGARVGDLIEASGAEVGVYYRALGGDDSLAVNADLRMHAASTMKVPVMIQLFRDRDAGLLSLDDPVEVETTFSSIVDGSPYELGGESDSEQGLYDRAGEVAPVGELIDLMITRSSNLATNLLIRLADAGRVTATMRNLGADSIEVLRGVEDIPAFRAGLSNTTTARDLGAIFRALGEGRAASPRSTEEMIAILEGQEFREKIPAGLPPGTRVANKTGWITGISHDAALVYPEGTPPYVLVVLVRGAAIGEAGAERLAAAISAAVWRHHTGGPGDRDQAAGAEGRGGAARGGG